MKQLLIDGAGQPSLQLLMVQLLKICECVKLVLHWGRMSLKLLNTLSVLFRELQTKR